MNYYGVHQDAPKRIVNLLRHARRVILKRNGGSSYMGCETSSDHIEELLPKVPGISNIRRYFSMKSKFRICGKTPHLRGHAFIVFDLDGKTWLVDVTADQFNCYLKDSGSDVRCRAVVCLPVEDTQKHWKQRV